MPWVKLSDDWYDDPDLIGAGPVAMLLWPVLISWCARNLTNGELPSSQVRRLVDWHALGIEPEQGIAPLIDKGRLQEIAGGYRIVNYLKFQPSREQVLAEREASRQRAAKSRERAAHSAGSAEAPDPVPGPVEPSPLPSSSDLEKLPADLWTTIAAKKLTKAHDVGNPSGWKRKVIANDKADCELVGSALKILESYEVTTSYLADCLIDGTMPSSAYRRKEPA